MNSKYKDEVFIDAFILPDLDITQPSSFENEKLLVITLRYVILMHYKDNKLIWDLESKNISNLTADNRSIKITHTPSPNIDSV